MKKSLEDLYTIRIQNSLTQIDFIYDLIIIDLSGILKEFDTLRFFKEKNNPVTIPVLAVISPHETEAAKRYFDYIDEVIIHPVEKDLLLFRVKNLLNRQSLVTLLKQKTLDQDTFMQALVHDIRNPVNHISNFIHLMKKELAPAEGSTPGKYFERITSGLNKITELVDSLSAFFKMDYKKIELSRINLKSVFELIQNELEEDIKKYHGTITLDVKINEFYTDISLFKIIFTNLILNSLQFRREESIPVINICAYPAGDSTIIKLKDNGIGFFHQQIDKIGRPFERLHIRKGDKGIGLGLYTVKRIVAILKGTMEVESIYGQGTTFTITF
ncbi:MAG: hypothetical protein JXJ04_18195 [Spirochaetales bacterium]|nr:hypothetical protein [Spirochaetales bacterium]